MTDSFNDPIGSIWRKWDLHVHTPASVLNNQFGSDWDVYVKTLFRALIEKNISVVGITDYFSIDGYKKIKEEYLLNETKLKELFSSEEIVKIKKILVLPNIEFRSTIFVEDKSVNFHIILSDDLEIRDIEEKFLHEVDFTYESDPQQPDKKRKLKEVNLIELGQRLKTEHAKFASMGSDLFIGQMNAVVDHEQISKILYDKKSIFGGKYLFVTVVDEDLSKLDWNARPHLTRKVFIQKADILFSSNKNTRDWGLGKPPYTEGEEKFIKEFKTLKPCIHGSDAHDFNEIAHPCAKRGDQTHKCVDNPELCKLNYCWIKADPTFEGLKQIKFEPEDRVIIQENDPTPRKSSQTISSFSIEASAIDSDISFPDINLSINSGLVAITGGKGGGKTALVDLLANMYENRAICNDKNSFVHRITDSSTSNDLYTRINLLSGVEKRKEIKEPSFIEEASIVYIAQGELEKHVEDPMLLEKHINDLIFESNEIKDSELLFDYQNINDEIADINEKIEYANQNIFELEKETDIRIEDTLQKDGKKLATDLKDVEDKVLDLSKSLSAVKIKEAEDKQKHLTDLREKKVQLNDLGLAIKGVLKVNEENLKMFNAEILKINLLAKKLGYVDEFKPIEYGDTSNLEILIGKVRDSMRKVIGEIEKFQKELDEKEKGVKEHAKLLDKKKQIENAILILNSKVSFINEKKLTLKVENEKRNGLFKDLLNKKIEQRQKYLAIIVAFSVNKNDILSDVEFIADLVFDQKRFIETISELVDGRKVLIKSMAEKESDIKFFTDSMEKLVAESTLEQANQVATIDVATLLDKIAINAKSSQTINRLTVYNSVFADYLTVTPSIKYQKGRLNKLSLGQKATVLIKIYLAQGENPIIIDSHDDHLDNEFIMEQLVKALRQAKQYRQIIIVSNNGNVVVNSDAEQVIIACRDADGQISYKSGSLENTSLRSKILCVLEGGEEAFSKRQKKYRLHH